MDKKWVKGIVVFLVIVGACLMASGIVVIVTNNNGLYDSTGVIRPHVELAFRLIYFGIFAIVAATTTYFMSILLRADRYMRSR